MTGISIFLLIGLLVSYFLEHTGAERASRSEHTEEEVKRAFILHYPFSCLPATSTFSYRLSSAQERARHASSSLGPRLIMYHQTFHDVNGNYHSLLPLLTNQTGVTHVIIAAIHLNEGAGNITLNDKSPVHADFDRLWAEVGMLQRCGVKVLGMLGGAAQGSYKRLGGDDGNFEAHYTPLRDMLIRANFDGIDIDIEEDTLIETVTRLIARLRIDFGPGFLITLAPVASALIPDPFIQDALYPLNTTPQCNTRPSRDDPTLPHLSGFSYPDLEQSEYGREISWYNTQFYGGWGSVRSTAWYDRIIEAGWSPGRIVMGTVTNPQADSSYVPVSVFVNVTVTLLDKYTGFRGGFGGVMGWEYVDSVVCDNQLNGSCAPDPSSFGSAQVDWAARLGSILRT